jgi:Transposase DDE domain
MRLQDGRRSPEQRRAASRRYSDLAIETALTLRAVFRLALRQSEGLIGSIMTMLEIDLPVPDHTTLSRRAGGLPVQMPRRDQIGDLHLIVDSTGLKLRGAGEWLFEKHGATQRRAWRRLHIGMDGASGEIVAFDLTDKDVDDASHVPRAIGSTDAGSRFFHGRWRIRQGCVATPSSREIRSPVSSSRPAIGLRRDRQRPSRQPSATCISLPWTSMRG